jgi:molecular chaperone GrpE
MSDETNGAPSAAPETPPGTGNLEAELAEAKDRLLRALAETENVRRRAQRERDDAQRFAISNFAKDLVNVADNLRRALESVPDAEAVDERTRNLLAGVAATERELLAAFERAGIRKVEPRVGDRFDHNQHEAMFEVENTGQPAGAIIQVLQPGYMIHDRLLRPAMVGVAKAAPGAGEPQRVNEVV